ncbi:Coenzyme F420 hydrogenase/dehydrogenase, beta subunit C-terminal domain [Butyricimonas hominis]|uniref:Coenzyme F420 hydrogenase/dehydrogenase, beta subunit C-terminal domain n=1 Tax=Butyricimonas hominis TaxID=2763032 RepID=A0ABR7CYJ5_9BACT|nr:Coenzyme F420 hydrogenase/dehydrogenase, beta subunit C-terminal domain [Butyricimonas hominis]MBC5620746.1 Coenzyme F420 hydrogenase/dehydrogenase, beta subunit C-terminal domain [Butyricimonas hominis]
MKYPELAHKKECTGCMACVDSCRFGALTSCVGTDGHLYPYVNVKLCVKCGACSASCPIITKSYLKKNEYVVKPYGAWSNDLPQRLLSASGGIFAALANKFLLEGGCVVGAIIDGFVVKYVLLEKLEDLHFLQGSKYQQGDLSGIYIRVKEKLNKGVKVLFSGVTCQIGGLFAFLKKRYENLYTVDIICAGFPSLLPMRQFIKENSNVVGIKSFRDKDLGWKSKNFKYALKGYGLNKQITDFGYKNLPILAFSSGLTNRYSCYACKFARQNRLSDLTIGDLWGDENFKDEHNNGISLVVIRSERGQKLIENSNITFHEISWQEALNANTRLIHGRSFLNFNIFRKYMEFVYKYSSYQSLMNLYQGRGFMGLIYRMNIVIGHKATFLWTKVCVKRFLNSLKNYEG